MKEMRVNVSEISMRGNIEAWPIPQISGLRWQIVLCVTGSSKFKKSTIKSELLLN